MLDTERAPPTAKMPATVECGTCEREIPKRLAYLRAGGKRYCTLGCLIKSGVVDRACTTCGASVDMKEAIVKNQHVFCNAGCFKQSLH